MSSGRRIVANLDYEMTLAASEGRTRRRLPSSAMRTLTAFGSLMRVFAEEGDRLWLPGPLRATRLPAVDGIPVPTVESNGLKNLSPASRWFAWGETEAVAELRDRDRRVTSVEPAAPEDPLWRRAWSVPAPIPSVARYFHRRSSHLRIADELGFAFPGRTLVRSIEDLEEHLDAGGAAPSPDQTWILKPPFSTAGRDWVRGRGVAIDPPVRNQLVHPFLEYDALLFEPRLARVRDLGVALAITESAVECIGVHEQETGPSGRFRAVRVLPREPEVAEDPFWHAVRRAALRIGEALRAQGFRGACGIDAWQGSTAEGRLHDQLLGEINARVTFGWIAHAWRARLVAAGRISPVTPMVLATSVEGSPPDTALPLLTPGNHDPTSAWIEA